MIETTLFLIVLALLAGFIIFVQDRQIDDLRIVNAELLDRLLEKNRIKPLMPPVEGEPEATPKVINNQPPPGFITQADADEQARDYIEEYVEDKLYGREFNSEMEKKAAIKQHIAQARKNLADGSALHTLPHTLVEDN